MKTDYRFKDKDPVIDEVRTAVQDACGERPMRKFIGALADDARLAQSTVRNLLYGATVRPQHRTVQAIFDACGVTTRRFWRDGEELRVAKDVWRSFQRKNVVNLSERRRKAI